MCGRVCLNLARSKTAARGKKVGFGSLELEIGKGMGSLLQQFRACTHVPFLQW